MGGVTFQSAGVGGVQFHGSSGSQESVNAAQFSSNNQAVSQVTNTQSTNVKAAVQAALLQMKQSSVSSSAFQAGQQTSGSTQVTGVTTVTETSISAAEENALIARIIKVLTPSITTSVRKALALRVQSVSSNQQSSIGATQQFGVNQQSASTGSAQQATFGAGGAGATFGAGGAGATFGASQQSFGSSQQSFGANKQSSLTTTSSSNVSSSKLVSQIVAALRPSITMSVAEALEASRVANAQNAFNSL